MRLKYRFKKPGGEVIAEGTTDEIAKQMGMSVANVQHMIYHETHRGELTIEEYDCFVEKKHDKKYVRAVCEWDKFVIPLREKYGVKQYKG